MSMKTYDQGRRDAYEQALEWFHTQPTFGDLRERLEEAHRKANQAVRSYIFEESGS